MQWKTKQHTATQQSRAPRAALRISRRMVGWLGVLSLVAAGVAADDRDLLTLDGLGSADPMVFIIFDTSGSMTYSPPCSPADTFDDIDPFDAMCTQECTLDDATCSRLCPSQGCREYDIADEDNPVVELEEIVIDNDAGSPDVTLSGTWITETSPDGFKGNDYLSDGNTGEDGLGAHISATYDPVLVNSGTYMIYMSYPDTNLQATNVMVDVTHVGGTDTVSVDQSITVETGVGTDFDGWNLIGSFTLDTAADSGTVTLRNESADFTMVADAVRWVRIDVPPCDDPLDLIYRCQQPICTSGDCWTPFNGDDPNSKFYQAKQALYEAVDSAENVHFGFGSFEQDNVRLQAKHWTYRVREEGPLAPGIPQILPTLGGTPLLAVGDDQVFGNYSKSGTEAPGINAGDGFNCHTSDSSSGFDPSFDDTREDQQVGCNSDHPVDITDIWEVQRGHRIPKLGYGGDFDTTSWHRKNYDDNELYRVDYGSTGASFGDDPFSAIIEVFHCPGGTCPLLPEEVVTVFYDLVSEYAARDGTTRREPQVAGGFFDGQGNMGSNNTCLGLEPNDDRSFEDNPDITSSQDDIWWYYGLKWPTTEDARGDDLDLDGLDDAPRQDVFDIGDRVPLDWTTSNVEVIKRRLAPNSVSGDDPDFRIATYFENDVGPVEPGNDGTQPNDSTDRRLRLLNDDDDGDTSDDERPLLPIGLTPLGEALADFKEWYAGPEDIPAGANPGDPEYLGWADVAARYDDFYPCRRKIVLLITDGVDTCFNGTTRPNDPCTVPGDLLDQEQILTYVVGFGVSSGSSLDCIAESGGTEAPILPRNKNELVEALQSILSGVVSEQRTFASASIPAVQSSAADKIFLSSFTPFDPSAVGDTNSSLGFWPGKIDAFRKPLPLKADNTPDDERACQDVDALSDDLQAACHLWEAGKVLCDQALLPAGNDFARKIVYGMDPTEDERVTASRPGTLRRFEVPSFLDGSNALYDENHSEAPLVEDLAKIFLEDSPNDDDNDLWEDYKNGLVPNSEIYDALDGIVSTVVGIKDLPLDLNIDACDTDGDEESDGYVLGDIFHASPISISGPSNFTYFANDFCGPIQRTDIPNNCVSPTVLPAAEDRGYRQFTADHVWRRRMLAAASNDGQLHFFDTGIRQLVLNDFTTPASDRIELFNDGEGKELFSYIPRMVLPILREQVRDQKHIFSMDGSVSVGDVFIDPIDLDGGDPVGGDRNWRTVVIGGLREAGDSFDNNADPIQDFKSGYYALDVTQPDILVDRPPTSSSPDDPTLVPCQSSGCDVDVPPAAEFPPSCLGLDAEGKVTPNGDCLHPAVAIETPQFPAELWTFTDSWFVEDPADPNKLIEYYLDEDAVGENGYGMPDLADTWSRPVIGQVAITENGAQTTKHVAILGAGMDPASKPPEDATDIRGHWLFMIDVETGLPIYKQKLCRRRDINGICVFDAEGSVPSDPAALDINADGILDVVYIGTTDGYLYKIDLSGVPALTSVLIDEEQLIRDRNASGTSDGNFDTYLSEGGALSEALPIERIEYPNWVPFPIVDVGTVEAGVRTPSPIYYAPAAFYIPERDQYGLAFGTGDREDLDSLDTEGGYPSKFFVVVDDDFSIDDVDVNSESSPTCIDDGSNPSRLPITYDCLTSFPFTAEPFDVVFPDGPDDPELIDLLAAKPDGSGAGIIKSLLDSGALLELPNGVDPVTEELRPGWVMSFPATRSLEQRITNEAFVVTGLLVFSVFDPNPVIAPSGDDDDDDDDDLVCGTGGTTRAFVLSIRSGGPVTDLSSTSGGGGGGGGGGEGDDDDDDDGGGDDDDDDNDLTEEDRFQEISEFTTAPFIERTATKNPGTEGKTLIDETGSGRTDLVREALLETLPRGTRFSEAFQIVIAALRNSTGVSTYATIPVGMFPADWRDQ